MRLLLSPATAVLILRIAIVFVISGCSDVDEQTQSAQTEAERRAAEEAACTAPGATPELARALCGGDYVQILMAIDKVLRAENRESFQALIRVMEHIWLLDQRYGTGLPWAALSDRRLRAEIAQYLAQEVRWGRSNLELRGMQELAVELSREPADAWKGIRLIGLTNAPGQVSFLKQVLDSDNASNREQAILALALICEQAAADLLDELASNVELPSGERKAVQEAVRQKSSWGGSLCARS